MNKASEMIGKKTGHNQGGDYDNSQSGGFGGNQGQGGNYDNSQGGGYGGNQGSNY